MGSYSYSTNTSADIIKTTVTTAGTYDITGYGGAGGNGDKPGPPGIGTYSGGSGAKVSGDFTLTAGEKLEIFVGGAGKSGKSAGGGGGGTFVFGEAAGATSYSLLLAAGGGGGASSDYGNGGAAPVVLSTSGGAGGRAGRSGGGGAGSTGNGASGTGYKGSYYGTGGISVTSATTPGAGGTYKAGRNQAYAGAGGFGGGGGANAAGGGGGGGFTGGNATYSGSSAAGGTSFLASAATMRTIASAASENTANAGAGEVTLTFVSATVCFAAGTRIRTGRGQSIDDVAVEGLVVDDLVVTATGAHRPIRWIGHRRIDCRNHTRPLEAMPIRISAHAFGANRPARDLLVSPGHAICVDLLGDVLIPAGALVNGATIAQLEADAITYWHVELDSHDILLAENLPAESYLDMGNRGFFAESGVVALDASPDAARRTHADFCRPFHAAGTLVEVVRAQLAHRAAKLATRALPRWIAPLDVPSRAPAARCPAIVACVA